MNETMTTNEAVVEVVAVSARCHAPGGWDTYEEACAAAVAYRAAFPGQRFVARCTQSSFLSGKPKAFGVFRKA